MIKKLLIYNSGGGIGDSIQLFPLILSLEKLFEKSEIYYLGAHENHYLSRLKEYNIKVKNLDLGVKYFGFRWWHYFVTKKYFSKLKLDKFDLIIDSQSKLRNTIILKQIPSKAFYSSTFNNIFCSGLNRSARKFSSDLKIAKYDIKNIPKKYFDEASRLLPNKSYVGFSLTQGNVYRKKEWPLGKIIKLSEELVKNNKTPVFFIEKKYQELKNKIAKLIPTALFPEHETEIDSPALVTCLGKRLDFAISIDNGIMHMLSLAKIPMVVLFGPTSSKKFAPNYNDIILLDSKKLKNTSNINSINVEDVLREVKLHSSFLY
jgi:ADP-heptose:LPS heptosyltransferase